MGTWETTIEDNDTFQDVYQSFFSLYNIGENPHDIAARIKLEFAAEFRDRDDKNEVLFALAFAMWETKSLEASLFESVKEIVARRLDLALWQERGANSEVLEKRDKVLKQFLLQLSTEKLKAKRRQKPKFEHSTNLLQSLVAPDNNKTFTIFESYVNGKYESTSSGISWTSGGGLVFYFHERCKFVSAHWIDAQTLEIQHDKTISFTQKRETFFFSGDQGVIRYIEV